MKNYSRPVFVGFLALTFTFFPPPVGAQEPTVGETPAEPGLRLTAMEGEVMVLLSDATEWVAAEPDAPLEPGDRVRTGSAGRAEIATPEGTVFELSENSESSVGEAGAEEISWTLPIGTILSRVQPKTRNVSIHTPTSILAVRGTEFAVEVGEDQTTNAGVYEGEVEVQPVDEEGRRTGETQRLRRDEAMRIARERRMVRMRMMREMIRHRMRMAHLRRRAEFWRARWRHLPPEERREMRERLRERWRRQPEERRREMRERMIQRWRNLSPQQRERIRRYHELRHRQRMEKMQELRRGMEERREQLHRRAEDLRRQGHPEQAQHLERRAKAMEQRLQRLEHRQQQMQKRHEHRQQRMREPPPQR